MSFDELYNNYNDNELDVIKEEENNVSSVAGSFVTNTENNEVQGGIPVSDFELPPRSLYHDIEEDDLSDAGCVAPDDDDDESSMPDFSTAGLVSALGTEGVEDYMMTAITPAIMPRKSTKTPYRTSEALSFAESTDLIASPAAVADMPDTPEKGGRELAVVTTAAAAAAAVPPGSPQPVKSPTLTTAEVLNVLNAREASERSRCRLLVIAATLTGLLVIGIALGAVFGMKPAPSEPTPRWAKDDASSENPPSTAIKTKIPMPSSDAPVSPVVSPSAESPIMPTVPIVPTFVPVFPTVSPQFIMSTPPTWRPTTKRPTTKRPTTKRPTTKAPTTASPSDSPRPSPSPSKSPSFSISPTDTQVPSGHPSLRPSRSKSPSKSLHPTRSPAPSPLPSFVPTKTATPTTEKEQKNNGKRERRRRVEAASLTGR